MQNNLHNEIYVSLGVLTAKIKLPIELPEEKFIILHDKKIRGANLEIKCYQHKPAYRMEGDKFVFKRKRKHLEYRTKNHVLGKINFTTGKGELNLNAASWKGRNYLLTHFIMGVFSEAYLYNNGFLLHASSVVKNGKGYLFVGSSGSGKSTVAQMKGWDTILADDVSCVYQKNKKWYVCGTPWDKTTNKAYPLKEIFFLNKGRILGRSIISKPIFFKEILKSTFRLDHGKQESDKLLDIIFDLSLIPSFELYFSLKCKVPKAISEWNKGHTS